MNYLLPALQIIVAMGLLNVWIVRFRKQTPYRGKNAGDMKEEFEAYGLPRWVMWLVGTLKICIALAMLAGIWLPQAVRPAAAILITLMLGALVMHLKVKDPFHKALPSLAMLLMAILLAVLPQ